MNKKNKFNVGDVVRHKNYKKEKLIGTVKKVWCYTFDETTKCYYYDIEIKDKINPINEQPEIERIAEVYLVKENTL